jgi:glycosyltransferase involved in cell wall biosynthesis
VVDEKKSLLWVTYLIIDTDLHRTSRIEILQNLAKRGYDVTLLAAYSETKPSFERIRSLLIPARKVPLLTYLILAITFALLLPVLILKLRPRFIITEPYLTTFFALITSRGIPRAIRPRIVVDVRSTPVEARGLNGLLVTLFFHAVMVTARNLLDGITTITTMMKRELCSTYRLDPNSVGVWTSGVSTEIFVPKGEKARQLREEMGLDGKFVVLYHGVLTPNRGVTEAIGSLKFLKGKYDKIVLLVLGKGPSLSSLKESSRREVAEGRLVFHGPVDYRKVSEYISASDVGIVPLPDIPDWRSQCPLNLLECLAAEKVVVATDIPANRNVGGDSKSVIYAKPDEEGIAKAIMYAFDNKDSLKEWGARGRALVKEEFDWPIIARNLDRYLATR